ncbi:MAG: helix-turn-helix domain-containing protein [Rubrivivax sp.]|jgi:lambda repressor-like predicted transcriptional regulator
MHPEQIKAALRMKGITPTALADELEVASSTMSQVIRGTSVSARIRAAISEKTGIPVSTLWPATSKPVLRRVARSTARAAA